MSGIDPVHTGTSQFRARTDAMAQNRQWLSAQRHIRMSRGAFLKIQRQASLWRLRGAGLAVDLDSVGLKATRLDS